MQIIQIFQQEVGSLLQKSILELSLYSLVVDPFIYCFVIHDTIVTRPQGLFL